MCQCGGGGGTRDVPMWRWWWHARCAKVAVVVRAMCQDGSGGVCEVVGQGECEHEQWWWCVRCAKVAVVVCMRWRAKVSVSALQALLRLKLGEDPGATN
jgi:hypothetical protein